MSDDKPSKPQIDKFRDAAREIGTDDDPERFEATVKKLAKAKVASKSKKDKSGTE